jgi:hypothetical protein
MSTPIYNNFKLNKAANLDTRLVPVATVNDLPDLNAPLNFLFEGAEIYVKAEKSVYRGQEDPSNPGTLIWEKVGDPALVVGTLAYLYTETTADLAQVVPDISTCRAVIVDVTGGSAATINSIINFPVQDITFYTTSGKQLTFKHTDLTVAGAGHIVLEVGANMKIKGRAVGNEYLILGKESSTIVQRGAVQFLSTRELLSLPTIKGEKGDKGDTGAQGIQGVPGAQGAQGLQGIQGLQGLQGDPGPIGLTGPQGDQGPAGVQGIQGLTGLQGLPGTNGANGADGADGFGYNTSSTTSLSVLDTLATSVAAVISTDKAYTIGARARFSSTAAPETAYFEGIVTAYNSLTGDITVSSIDVKKGSGTIAAWNVNVAGEKPELYDSGWKALTMYTGVKGYGMANINLYPSIRIIGRTVYMSGTLMLPLADNSNVLQTNFSLYPAASFTKVYTDSSGAGYTANDARGTLTSTQPILPLALRPQNNTLLFPGVNLIRRVIAPGDKYCMLSATHGVVLNNTGLIVVFTTKYLQDDNSGGGGGFTTLQLSHSLSRFNSGERAIQYDTSRNSYDAAGINLQQTQAPGSLIFPFTFDCEVASDHGGFAVPLDNSSWLISNAVSMLDIKTAFDNL